MEVEKKRRPLSAVFVELLKERAIQLAQERESTLHLCS